MWYVNTTGLAITINESQKGSAPPFSPPQCVLVLLLCKPNRRFNHWCVLEYIRFCGFTTILTFCWKLRAFTSFNDFICWSHNTFWGNGSKIWMDCSFRRKYFIFHRQAPSILCGVQSLSTLQFLKQEMVTFTVLLAERMSPALIWDVLMSSDIVQVPDTFNLYRILRLGPRWTWTHT